MGNLETIWTLSSLASPLDRDSRWILRFEDDSVYNAATTVLLEWFPLLHYSEREVV